MDIIEAYLKYKKGMEIDTEKTEAASQDTKYHRPCNFDEFLLERFKQESVIGQHNNIASRQEWLDNRNRNEE